MGDEAWYIVGNECIPPMIIVNDDVVVRDLDECVVSLMNYKTINANI